MTSHLERVSTSPPLVRRRVHAAPLHRSLRAPAALWLVLRLYQIALGCSGDGTDVLLYHRYASEMLSGAAASDAFQPEYPPGALTLFLLPALGNGDAAGYERGFLLVAALFDLGACLLVFHRARLRAGRSASAQSREADPRPNRPVLRPFIGTPLFHASLYLVLTAALWPVLYARFDIVPAALVLAAFHCLDRHRDRAAAAILGAAGAVKLWPLALLPIWALWRGGAARLFARDPLRRLLSLAAWVSVGVVIAVLPVVPLINSRIGSSLRYLTDRGLEIESTWATAVLVSRRLGLTEAHVEDAFGSTQIAGSLPLALAHWSLPVTLLLVAAPMLLAISARRRATKAAVEPAEPSFRDSGRLLETAVLAIVLGLMLGSKVLSPQFVLWVAPLLALTVRSAAGFLLAFLTAALTTQVYPHLFAELYGLGPGHDRAVAALVLRNGLLAGWYLNALRRMAKQGAPARRLWGGSDRTLRGLVLPLRPSGR